MGNESAETGEREWISAPLHCWDIFMDSYHRKMALAGDRQRLEQLSTRNTWNLKWDMGDKLLNQGKVILVTDPSLHIIFASSNITAMNGYQVEEVIGNYPRMFQGEATTDTARQHIRKAVQAREHFEVSLINYKKSGELYHCRIEGYPLFNRKKEVVNFIAFETAGVYQN